MALFKNITKSNGITTSYHKVTSVTIDKEHGSHVEQSGDDIQLVVRLTSYFNKEYRENEQPIESKIFYFNITSEEEESTSARKLAYTKIKTLAEWADAEDC